jgi:hypothetical protein
MAVDRTDRREIGTFGFNSTYAPRGESLRSIAGQVFQGGLVVKDALWAPAKPVDDP